MAWLRRARRLPAATNLAAGLVVTLSSPALGREERWEVRGRGAFVTLRLQRQGSGRFDQQSTRFGIYPRESWASALPWPGDRGGIETVLRLARLPPKPREGLRWSAPGCETQRALSEQGITGWEETLPVEFSIAAGSVGSLRLGAGRLAVLPLEGAIQRQDGVTHLRWLWFPGLGFGVQTGEGKGPRQIDWQVTAIMPLVPQQRPE